MTTATYTTDLSVKKNREKIDQWPYLPNQPEWKVVRPLFDVAATVNPEAQTFIGARKENDGTHFYFQERGNPSVVVVVK